MAVDPWWAGLAGLMLALGCGLGWYWRGRLDQARKQAWPKEWNLNARPMFSTHERALYRDLKAALPNHVILAKVGILRFCHSGDEKHAREWYERLNHLNVSMAICTPNGAVVSVIDIDTGHSGRSAQKHHRTKEAVMEACRIRYVRCQPGQWPQAELLAPWALGQTGSAASASSSQQTGMRDKLNSAGNELANKLKQRRAERKTGWSESGFSQDSFFATDSRFDHLSAANSMPGTLDELERTRSSNPVKPSPESN